MADKRKPKADISSWTSFQLRSDAREALDELRKKNYTTAKSYSDVILALVDEHNNHRKAE